MREKERRGIAGCVGKGVDLGRVRVGGKYD